MAKKRRRGHPERTRLAGVDSQGPKVASSTGIGVAASGGEAFWKTAQVPTAKHMPGRAGSSAPRPNRAPFSQSTTGVRGAGSSHAISKLVTPEVDGGAGGRAHVAPSSDLAAPDSVRKPPFAPLPEADHGHPLKTTSSDAPVTDTRAARSTPWIARRSGTSATSVTSVSCGPVQEMEPQSLGVTYWFETEPTGEPYSVNLYLQGRRRGGEGTEGTHFNTVTTVKNVIPGSGPVSVTSRITDAQPGTWDITATPVRRIREDSPEEWEAVQDPLLPAGGTSGPTLFAPFNRAIAPGVLIGAWPAMVSLGAVLGVGLQSALAGRLGLPNGLVAALTVIACLLGVLGAKAYYLVTHPEEKRRILTSGMSVQGFVITVVLVLLLGGWALSIPVGSLFDVSAPGLLLGMAVGRLGCLLGGCCAGRPTRSRWGVWSSDRRLGARRIPVQLLESSTALLICMTAATAVVTVGVSGGGLVFLATVAAYTAARQVLFPLRDLPRATTHGRQLTLATSVAFALAAIGGLLLHRL